MERERGLGRLGKVWEERKQGIEECGIRKINKKYKKVKFNNNNNNNNNNIEQILGLQLYKFTI